MNTIEEKRDTPSYHRNIEPIVEKLHEVLSVQQGRFLEIASGSGQHVARFSDEFSKMIFQPTEYDAEALPSIRAWTHAKENVLEPLQLDVTKTPWFEVETPSYNVIFCSNVIHISPWEVTEALFAGAAKNLKSNGQLILYGPYRKNGEYSGEGDIEFEKWLKSLNPSYAIRDIHDVCEVAKRHGLVLDETHIMPANNFIQVFNHL